MSLKNDYMEWQHDNDEEYEYEHRVFIWVSEVELTNINNIHCYNLIKFEGTTKDRVEAIKKAKEVDSEFKIVSEERFDSVLDWAKVYRPNNKYTSTEARKRYNDYKYLKSGY